MKRLLTTALLLTFTVLSFAQVRTKTEEVTIYGATDYYGTMKYNYVVDDEGNHIMHGNVSINGKTDQMVEEIRSQYVGDGSSFMLGDYRYTSQYHRAVDSFSLTAQFNNGIINGPITISHKSSYIGEDKNYSLKGSFKDGKPEGVFSLSLNDQEGKHSYTVSFHDGILISTNYYNDVFKGTVSNDRIISGIWDSGDGLEEEYVNGVLVRESKPGKDTPPKLEELARRYAYNEISVGDLLENGYYVTYNTFDYGSDIWHIIIGNEYFANWTDLLGIDLEKPDTDIIYRSLDIPKYASDNELEKIAQGYPGIIEYLKPYYEEQDVPLYVVKYNEYYPSEYSTSFVERFISVQQKARLDSLIEEKQMLDKAVDFMDYLVSKGIINDNDFDVIRRARSIFTKEAQRTTINRFYEQYKSLVQKIDNNPEISLLNWETDNSGRV
ncbi:MAG: hypothetical protein J5769_06660, partial [Bacteroidales bacterium]|nr:hypothetical protein [Bacteroidales bacterium]